MHTKFRSENLKGRHHMGDIRVYWRIILKYLCGIGTEDDWVQLAQDRVQWRDLVNTVWSNEPSVSTDAGHFLTSGATINYTLSH
jgi:hypothetical protein